MRAQKIILICLLMLITKIVAEQWLDNIIKAIDEEYERLTKVSNRTKRSFNGFKSSDFRLRANPNQIINHYGYKSEKHFITTKDGYKLTLHRITGNKTHPSAKGKKPVLLQHGLIGSAMDWIITGPSRGLAFLLSNNHYDVWLGNARGNKYSRKHRDNSIDAEEYWDFSWHEIGKYDLAAMIDYILEKTGERKLAYVGYSQGTTASYVLLSERPEYNSKIGSLISLAPVCYFSELEDVLEIFSETSNFVYKLIRISQFFELPPSNELSPTFVYNFCSESFDTCKQFLMRFMGLSEELFDPELYLIVFQHYPAGSSMKQIIHYGQLMRSKIFRQFDYGKIKNMFVYGTFDPPEYDISKITAPVTLFVSEKDRMSRPKAAKRFYNQLSNKKGFYLVPHPKFAHLDFIFAKNLNNLLNNKVLSELNQWV